MWTTIKSILHGGDGEGRRRGDDSSAVEESDDDDRLHEDDDITGKASWRRVGLRLGLPMAEPEFNWRTGNAREGGRRRFLILPNDPYVTYFSLYKILLL